MAIPVPIITTLGTKFFMEASDSSIVSELKKKISEEHMKMYPDIGKVNIQSLKVEIDMQQIGKVGQGKVFFTLAESMNVKSALIKSELIYVDMERVSSELPLEPKTVVEVDNVEEGTMKKGEDGAVNFELNEVLEPGKLKKSSKKRKSKKSRTQPPSSDAAQVVGSQPHQTFNGNHSDQGKGESSTMVGGGQSASEKNMVTDIIKEAMNFVTDCANDPSIGI